MLEHKYTFHIKIIQKRFLLVNYYARIYETCNHKYLSQNTNEKYTYALRLKYNDDMTGFKIFHKHVFFFFNNSNNKIQKTSAISLAKLFHGQFRISGTLKFFTEFLLMKLFPLLFHSHSF